MIHWQAITDKYAAMTDGMWARSRAKLFTDQQVISGL
jgi:hypothetical protein